MEENKMQVYVSIAEIQGEMAKEGIGKDNTNKQQGWKFRGIDDVYNALAPKLSKNKLVIIPTVLGRTTTERKSKDGYALYSTAVRVAYDIVSAIDGSKHTMVMDGEAMDSGDKSTSKAVSIAYKYACFQLFCIPVEGEDNDPDATSHKVVPSMSAEKPAMALPEAAKAVKTGDIHTIIDTLTELRPTKSSHFFTLIFADGTKIGCGAHDAVIAKKALESNGKLHATWKQDGPYKTCVKLTEVIPATEEVPF